MKKLPIILSLLFLACLYFSGCEVENCPPNTMSYAYFALVDQHGRSFNTSDTITIVGQTHVDIVVYDTLSDGTLQARTVQDSLVSDTLINKEAGASSFELPFSYNTHTRFVFIYHSLERRFSGTDTINIEHRNIPYFINLECSSMMFYEVTKVENTRHRLDSLTITNPNIDNNEKENFKIYFTVLDADE